MSLTRSLLNEFRPLFRLLEEPIFRPTPFERFSHLHPFQQGAFLNAFRPNVYVAEQPKAYIVEAELPGVRKDDIDVRVGDNGQSIIIEGKFHSRWGNPDSISSKAEAGEGPSASDSTTVTNTTANTAVSAESSSDYVGESESTFTRTVWLPRPVDSQNVSAKLQDGVLTLTVPKMEDKEAVKVVVE